MTKRNHDLLRGADDFCLVGALARNFDYAICPAPSAEPACTVRMTKPAPMLILDWIKCASICSLA
jgi:hypothetical protein